MGVSVIAWTVRCLGTTRRSEMPAVDHRSSQHLARARCVGFQIGDKTAAERDLMLRKARHRPRRYHLQQPHHCVHQRRRPSIMPFRNIHALLIIYFAEANPQCCLRIRGL